MQGVEWLWMLRIWDDGLVVKCWLCNLGWWARAPGGPAVRLCALWEGERKFALNERMRESVG